LFSTQGYSQRKDIDFGLLLGTIQYNGDVNMTRAYTSPRPAIALIFRKNYNPHYSLRFDATFGRLACIDENFHNNYQQNRDYSFDDSRVMELTGMVEFNFFEVTTNKKEKNFSPYVVFGLGAMYIENVKWYALQPIGTEGQNYMETRKPYSLYQFCIPMGLIAKYSINKRWAISGEVGVRFLFTDYLDDVSTTYADPELVAKNVKKDVPEGVARLAADPAYDKHCYDWNGKYHYYNEQRGDPYDNDFYMFIMISAHYRLKENDSGWPTFKK